MKEVPLTLTSTLTRRLVVVYWQQH